MNSNLQLNLAYNFVTFTDRNIFLTGKAGTGKTTFLHNLKKSSPKRMAIVAPTGVAAINAGGVTIHSFFQMPFGPYVAEGAGLANDNAQRQKRFNRDKINLIRSLDLLVIDEISMVRADTLDNMDEILKRYKNPNKPFGGVQLLMIGDLHQLSPVVKDEEWRILKDFYPNMYFFSSKALQKTLPVSIELKHIYRQSDTYFIDLLNSVRQNNIDANILQQLNQRYIPDFKPADDEGYITLTTHNQSAQQINEVKLKEINKPVYTFSAVIRDDFPEYTYPTIAELELKIGSQVMFVKNDPSRERLFYNGKIGRVLKIENEIIYVKCPGDLHVIKVEPLDWTNIKYTLNTQTKEVEEQIIGSFTQYPLKLAWAITIHKSQGLTFEKAIIDANAAFAHGQVYVALSRCKSFEGMVLRSPISFNSVKTDGTVAEYTKNADKNAPGEQHLQDSKIAFQQSLLYQLFDFTSIKSRYYHCRKLAEDHHPSLPATLINELNTLHLNSEKEIYTVANIFKKQLGNLLISEDMPEENTELQERLKKACSYFHEKIETGIYLTSQKINIDSDNKAVQASITEAMATLQKEAFVKMAGMKVCQNGFSTLSYLQTTANAEIDYSEKSKNNKQIRTVKSPSDIAHPKLYTELKRWRDNLAEENDLPVYMVLPQKALEELVKKLPSNLDELGSVKGIGKTKVKQYGSQIMKLINDYCEDNDIQRTAMMIPLKAEKIKIDTKKLSFDLYKEGKSIAEIASERGFTTATIEGHLAHFISSGEISIFDIVSKLKVARIMAYIIQHPGAGSNEIKSALGDDISYGDLKAVMNHLAFINAEVE
ncbi:helix-turn-helix domain-containing protein [Daejeonella oryzae]|uniref:helix-turn-helix domain-containing protein n=1 Tax=Daejeonella oryzae TaxID=1122943 RepID=UPI0004217AF6|nr:helix-turn-helix domain-containing protein [Daejeonella oryzae]